MNFNWLDGLVVISYLAAITVFGVHFRKQQQSMRTYFLGGKTVPAWALSLSIVATETSTLTIIGTPAIAYGGQFHLSPAGNGISRRPDIYLPGLHPLLLQRRNVYGLRADAAPFRPDDQTRDGKHVPDHARARRRSARRCDRHGREYRSGHGDIWSIVIISALTLIYTFEGGLTAVIWTDMIHLCIYIGGALVAFFMILSLIPSGWSGIMANAGPKFVLWNFSTDYHVSYTFWAGVIGGAFLNLGSHGVDQLIVQRLLAARNERESKVALLSSGLLVFFQFSLFLTIGVMLFSFYRYHPEEAVPGSNDAIFPTFVVHHLPHGVAGLMIAAILAARCRT